MTVLWQGLLHGLGQLLAYFYHLIPSYGVAIVLLTVTVRLVMVPLAVKQARMMEAARPQQEKLRKLQPELKKLKEKHKDDRQKYYEEMQKLQSEHGIKPLAGLNGCLPMLIQAPVWFAMYRVLQGCAKFVKGKARQCVPGFAGIKYLPAGSALRTALMAGQAGFLGMNLAQSPSQAAKLGAVKAWPYYLLVVLMGVTTFVQQRQMTKSQPQVDPQQAQMMKTMQFLPLMFIYFSISFPAGLTLYWTTSNLWTMGQQYLLMKRYGPAATKLKLPGKVAPGEKGLVNKQPASPNGSGGDGPSPTGTNGAGAQGQRKGSGARKRKRKKGKR